MWLNEQIPTTSFENQVESLPRRLERVTVAKGSQLHINPMSLEWGIQKAHKPIHLEYYGFPGQVFT